MQKINRFTKRLKVLLTSCVVVATTVIVTSCEKDTLEDYQPLSASIDQLQHGATVPGKYIVVFKDNVDFGLEGITSYDRGQGKMRQASQAILKGKGIPADRIEHVYSKAIKGLAVNLTSKEVKQLKEDKRVAYIEKDRVIKLAPPAGKGPKNGGGGSDPAQETPWGINRIGGATSATSKTAWVIDTGIDLDHADLNVDIAKSRTMFTKGKDGSSADDGNGHGTHVAGTIAGINNSIGVVGVAAGATVVAVKVLDSRGSGSYSGVIAGVDYVASVAASGDVANMSLGGPTSDALDAAIIKAANKGIKFALAAGNDGANANFSSPARVNHKNVYTISAIDVSDRMASWSNWGNPPVDFAAPGVGIKSTWKDGGYNTISGTSMASPHVAGLMLLGNVGTSGFAKGDPDGNPDPIAHK